MEAFLLSMQLEKQTESFSKDMNLKVLAGRADF